MLIGLVGYKRAGKSETAKVLAELNFLRMGFVDPARDFLHSLGVPWENITGELKDEPLEMLGGKSGRTALKTLTTEWGRSLFGEGFWIDRWSDKYREIQATSQPGGGRVVIEDMRMLAEARAVRARGGLIWRIDRKGCGPELGANGHRTEQEIELIDYDRLIVNNGTLLALRHEVLGEILRLRAQAPTSDIVPLNIYPEPSAR